MPAVTAASSSSAAGKARPTRPGDGANSSSQHSTLTEALAAAWHADHADVGSAAGDDDSGGARRGAPRRLAALGVELDSSALARLVLLAPPLSRGDLHTLVSLGGSVRFDKGELVMRARRPQAQLMRVRKGALRIVSGVGSVEGAQKAKDVLGSSVLPPGTFFGELSLVSDDADALPTRDGLHDKIALRPPQDCSARHLRARGVLQV